MAEIDDKMLEEIKRDLKDRAHAHYRRLEAFRAERFNISMERRTLLYLSEKLGVDADPTNTYLQILKEKHEDDHPLSKLARFKVEHKGQELPLMSETVLYETFGKEDARTILAFFGQACEKAGLPEQL